MGVVVFQRPTDFGDEGHRIHRLRHHGRIADLLGVIGQIVAAHENRPHLRIRLLQRGAQREAVGRLHHHIGDQDVHAAEGRCVVHRLLCICGHTQFVSGQRPHNGHEGLQNIRFIVNNQDSHENGSLLRKRR